MAKIPPILYCGDHDIDDAARYLAGALKAAGLPFDYLPSNARFSRRTASTKYGLYILSDYPKRFLGEAHARLIAGRVRDGAGLLMIGGWGSFRGVDGLYGSTALAEALPVRCAARDDRQQGAAAYRIAPGKNAGLLGKPVFDLASAPTLAGYNKTVLKPGAAEILRIETLRFGKKSDEVRVTASDPLLAVRPFGRGRAVAYCSDLAPHWSGGLVDWGSRRITLKAAPGITAQAGSEFVRFAQKLVTLASTEHGSEK